jgi:hypothetical protein
MLPPKPTFNPADLSRVIGKHSGLLFSITLVIPMVVALVNGAANSISDIPVFLFQLFYYCHFSEFLDFS